MKLNMFIISLFRFILIILLLGYSWSLYYFQFIINLIFQFKTIIEAELNLIFQSMNVLLKRIYNTIYIVSYIYFYIG